MPRIARVLKAIDAQVIALQEVILDPRENGGAQPVDILAGLSGFCAICAPIVRGRDPHYGNALLTRLPILARGNLEPALSPLRAPYRTRR